MHGLSSKTAVHSQLDAFVPHRRGTSVPVNSRFYLQAPIHKLQDESHTVSRQHRPERSEATSGRPAPTYLHIGVLDAEYGRISQPFGGDDVHFKLALAAGHLPQDCRLSYMQTYLDAHLLVFESVSNT